ncbi:MAG: hypothetical protein SF029_16440 [bacterium]|nr:hypothetical protein [bacterium]
MEQRTVILNIPAETYERLQQKAEAANRPLEVIAVESLTLLYGDLGSESNLDNLLNRLPGMTDNELWLVVYSHLSPTQTQRLDDLSSQRKQRAISGEEQNELDGLLEIIDRQMLLRARALQLLKARGQDIGSYAGINL